MFIMNTIFYSRVNSNFDLHNLFVGPIEEDMEHCVEWMGTTKTMSIGIYSYIVFD